jgi:hypothetical protein
MDVDFMYIDSMEVSTSLFCISTTIPNSFISPKAIRPKLVVTKSLMEAADAVDEMFNSALQDAGGKHSYTRRNIC